MAGETMMIRSRSCVEEDEETGVEIPLISQSVGTTSTTPNGGCRPNSGRNPDGSDDDDDDVEEEEPHMPSVVTSLCGCRNPYLQRCLVSRQKGLVSAILSGVIALVAVYHYNNKLFDSIIAAAAALMILLLALFGLFSHFISSEVHDNRLTRIDNRLKRIYDHLNRTERKVNRIQTEMELRLEDRQLLEICNGTALQQVAANATDNNGTNLNNK